ncbi:23S rRNA (pseudouridine(1915)-N(3))-methyltransferase RlmH [Salisediminibacterium halotolerans]|uniref:Ribosomal RNA large subunit methyltransferase H n=1 Tax=Salisediminibacterium halotolerans TaxID=517425 RepID=A0A1H9WKX4_9BACI|nr:23S rRNA (pseudouridine(1915)-N(3))-methyltransferase RlmH [Salisediminibacterium haloalkalitolerans]SES34515.1 23S rRNA (pseudouridine1915-N3)-methyltransferase [Salisediminibacterium haloalkalitolerans]
MKIKLIAVGKLKEKYLKQGIDEYTKRLSAFATVEHIEVADEKAPEQMSETEIKQVQEKEGERILQKIHKDDYVTALAIDGKQWSSERLAKEIDQLTTHGKSKLTFVIGGSVGLSDSVMKRADQSLSFSAMTFPHQLMRLILLEQIYRAFKINRGEPYHK